MFRPWATIQADLMNANRHPFRQEYSSPKKMGLRHQYQSKKHPTTSSRLLRLTIPKTSSFIYDSNDFLWTNPNELDLLNMKKAPLIDENHFFHVRPTIRRLYTTLNSRCPNLYRIHCSNSSRVLQEMLCLIEQYLKVRPPTNFSLENLLNDDDLMDDFIDQVKFSTIYPFYYDQSPVSEKIDIRCYGQGIRASDANNQLDQKLLFCFELTTSIPTPMVLAVDVRILDPNDQIVMTDLRYINTFDQDRRKLFSCSYTANTFEGTYKISFIYKNVPLLKYPYAVFIRNPRVKATAIEMKAGMNHHLH